MIAKWQTEARPDPALQNALTLASTKTRPRTSMEVRFGRTNGRRDRRHRACQQARRRARRRLSSDNSGKRPDSRRRRRAAAARERRSSTRRRHWAQSGATGRPNFHHHAGEYFSNSKPFVFVSLAKVEAVANLTREADKNGFESEDDSRFKFAQLAASAVKG